ncbi:MAG: 23S rRNA (adenine(2503)-C(2))-methyltransferase RlmN [Clostridia bacterium]|nr:23S rRNA (adenine(2503)-C(2))-methyltransferase RlmN [Clostridia bacterium]
MEQKLVSRNKADILSMTEEELVSFVSSELSEPAYRGAQIYSWMQKGASFDEMTNIPSSLRKELSECAEYRLPRIVKRLSSKLDGTVKYLFELSDGERVESVFMKYEHGNTVCVSCQAGCRMGCRFCASTLKGKRRDLLPSEILGQVIAIKRDTGERIGGIVMMGIGEPFDNYDAAVKFLRLVSDEKGLGIGLRHISVSTCGIVPGIKRLAKEGLPVTLSVSLHASDDETRSSIMPINKKYGISELLEACNYYFDKTGRRVSFEYTLIAGKNDGAADAESLAKLLKSGMKSTCHVNLIRLNEVKEISFTGSAAARANAFCEKLNSLGVKATVRRRLGSDINASCGQLRLSASEDEN